MKPALQHIKLLSTRIFILVLIYAFCRILFFLFNYRYFTEFGLPGLLSSMVYGLRFDLSAIATTNFLFIACSLLPLPFRGHKAFKTFLLILFVLINTICILANCVDLAYFPFTQKRSTAEVLSFFSMGDDLSLLLPAFLKDYWYVFIIWISLTLLMIYSYRKASSKTISNEKFSLSYFFIHTSIFAATIGLSVVGFRGGWQLKPINVASAGNYVEARFVPVVVNTPFSILKTVIEESITEVRYISPEEAKAIIDPIQQVQTYTPVLKGYNVVFIILESFSKEYTGFYNKGQGYTPFLDSLMGIGYNFTNAYANSKRSIEGIPAILSGLPGLMNAPFISSIYGSNQLNSMASILKKDGYHSGFFHGGSNGTMSFDQFTSLAGFDEYYGRTEYNNEKDYDGNWGIWDEPFLQHYAQQMKIDKPFFNVCFTLTSHHPYTIPDTYKNIFKEGRLPIHKTIAYTDNALRSFFKTASKMPWYKNTLFIITADHTGVSDHPFYMNAVGRYQIPLIFYTPELNWKGQDSTLVQQTDIMPSTLSLLGCKQSFYSFGSNVFDSTAHHFVTMFEGTEYQLLEADYLLRFNGIQSTGLFNFKTDSLLQKNLISDQKNTGEKMEKLIKAIIQRHHTDMLHNTMIVK